MLEALTGLDRFTLARQFRPPLRHEARTLSRPAPPRRRPRRRLRRTPLAAAALPMPDFADQSHFTRQFKRAYGITPERWRRDDRMLIEEKSGAGVEARSGRRIAPVCVL